MPHVPTTALRDQRSGCRPYSYTPYCFDVLQRVCGCGPCRPPCFEAFSPLDLGSSQTLQIPEPCSLFPASGPAVFTEPSGLAAVQLEPYFHTFQGCKIQGLEVLFWQLRSRRRSVCFDKGFLLMHGGIQVRVGAQLELAQGAS